MKFADLRSSQVTWTSRTITLNDADSVRVTLSRGHCFKNAPDKLVWTRDDKGELRFLIGVACNTSRAAYLYPNYDAIEQHRSRRYRIGLARLPDEIAELRPSLEAVVTCLRHHSYYCFGAMIVMFVVALWLYFGVLGGIDVDALRNGEVKLQTEEVAAVYGITALAILFLAIDAYLVTLRQRLAALVQSSK
jgi:hypothetical protein